MSYQETARPSWWHRIEYGATRLVLGILAWLPERPAYAFAGAAGRLFFRCAASRRLLALRFLRQAYPEASDAALVIAQACGVAPEAQPVAAPAEALRYVPTAPAEALLAGLTARARRYAQLGVQGPGVSIQLQGTEG